VLPQPRIGDRQKSYVHGRDFEPRQLLSRQLASQVRRYLGLPELDRPSLNAAPVQCEKTVTRQSRTNGETKNNPKMLFFRELAITLSDVTRQIRHLVNCATPNAIPMLIGMSNTDSNVERLHESPRDTRKRVRPKQTGMRLDENLRKEAKIQAVREDITMTELVNRAIRLYLRTPPERKW
jgi:hypothetical protein